MRLVIQNSAAVWGGNEKWLATVAAGLMARGHEVVVSCRGNSEVERALRRRGIPTVAIRPGGYADIIRGLRFWLWLRRIRPEVVLLTSWRSTAWGAFTAKRAGVPRVIARVGLLRVPRRRRHEVPFRRWIDALIVNDPEIRRAWAAGAHWFVTDHIHVVLNGVEATPLGEIARQSLRRQFGAGPGTIVIGVAGHVTRRKGFDLLLDAVARLGDDRVRVAIVGTGPEEAALRARAQRLGMADRVCWLGRRDDVPDVLAACDIFALTSRNEGMANVMLEAMAVGTPVIATDISGVRTAIDAEAGGLAAGWIVPPGDVDALASALREVIEDLRSGGDAVARRVHEASRRVRQRFSVERMLDEVERALLGRQTRLTATTTRRA